MEIEFRDKKIVVTGATSGIGRATALAFVEAGAGVLATGRNKTELETLKEECNNKTGVCEILAGDLVDVEFRKELIDTCISIFGGLDILVNAAGIIASGTLENTSLVDYDYMMDLNLRAVFHLMQLSLPHLEEGGGNIVNVSSVTGLRAFPGILTYCISKAGVDQLTRAAALELAEKNIRVNAINPGVVETNLHKNSGMEAEAYSKFLEHSKSTHPLGRVGKPGEAADLILFLASDRSGWITGVTCSLDGGRQLTCAR